MIGADGVQREGTAAPSMATVLMDHISGQKGTDEEAADEETVARNTVAVAYGGEWTSKLSLQSSSDVLNLACALSPPTGGADTVSLNVAKLSMIQH